MKVASSGRQGFQHKKPPAAIASIIAKQPKRPPVGPGQPFREQELRQHARRFAAPHTGQQGQPSLGDVSSLAPS